LNRVQGRQLFLASVVELQEIPGSKPAAKGFDNSDKWPQPQLNVKIKSQAFYEDADLTRLLHTLTGPHETVATAAPPHSEDSVSTQPSIPSQASSGDRMSSRSVSTPVESVLMTGIPETIPIWQQVVLNNETLLLLLVKHQADD
jgi:hypothetical protein